MKLSTFSDIPWFRPYMAMSTSAFRERLVRAGILERRCYECGLVEWCGNPAPLQLDHIDGDRDNNMAYNLRILCANCHALTDTFSGRNKCNQISVEAMRETYDRYLSEHGVPPSANKLYILLGRARGVGGGAAALSVQNKIGMDRPLAKRVNPSNVKTKITWPSDEDLAALLEIHSRVTLGNMLGVSDNAIKKRCEKRGIPLRDSRKRRNP